MTEGSNSSHAGNGMQGVTHGESKAAAERFTVARTKELGARGVTANAVSPNITNTDDLVVPQAMIKRMKSMIPLGRIGESEDIANVVASWLDHKDMAAWSE